MKVQFNTGINGINYIPVKNEKNNNKYTADDLNFRGKLPESKDFLDKVLEKGKGLFKLADINPFAFNVACLLTTCVVMRPLTILALPGTNKEDKQYAAGKSVISATLANTSRLIFILPLGIMMKNLGKNAKEDPSFRFPKIKTRRFNAFNYLVNNASAFLLSIPMSAVMVVAVAKIMNKIMPPNGMKTAENRLIGRSDNEN